MKATVDGAKVWAREEFGYLEAGDVRRRERVIKMAAVAAAAALGTVARTYDRGADRQAAYDLLESGKVRAEALTASMSAACVDRCRGQRRVYVPIDGSSVGIVDRKGTKNFGAVGSYRNDGRGLKVVTAIAVSTAGTPLGICAQQMWARSVRRHRRSRSTYRPTNERETRFFVDAIRNVCTAFEGTGVSPTCIIDRSGDATEILYELVSTKTDFIVRSSWDRRLVTVPKTYLRQTLARTRSLGRYDVAIPEGFRRVARVATVSVRATRVTLDFKHDWQGRRGSVEVVAISAKETSPPAGEKALHWILLTNLAVNDLEQAVAVVRAYTLRWRIEEFHKAWKTGTCNVEAMQLRTYEAASTWATLLAAVAIRAERLKQLARNEPDLPASVGLTPTEIEATILLKRRQKKKTETIPDGMPTISQIVLWIAELGSYTGKSSGGPPGVITISRGLEKVRAAALAVEELRASGQIR
jgi:hypothetical protein